MELAWEGRDEVGGSFGTSSAGGGPGAIGVEYLLRNFIPAGSMFNESASLRL